jgi:stage II sporulation protein D
MSVRLSRTTVTLLCLFAIGLCSASVDAAQPDSRTTLRVGLWTLWHDHEVKLIPGAPGHAINLRTCAGCAAIVITQPASIRAAGDALVLTEPNKSIRTSRVSIAAPVTLAAHGENLTLPWPLVVTARSGALVLAVTMPVETYVERVVASESDDADSAASLEALAIVVRTFALHQPHGHTDYDLCDSTHCQLVRWNAGAARLAMSRAAALATAGETLWFQGRPALAYFGKDCGGYTASPAEIWPGAQPLAYLPARPDSYCARDGGHEWASEISFSDITAALATHGLARPGWHNLAVAQRGSSGRAVTLRADGTTISAEQFRLAVGESLGWVRLPSTWFEVSQQGDRFIFHGRGWGNGVGLCQRGAAEMAAQGRSAAEILAQYFPGAQAADEATGRMWQRLSGQGFQLESLESADAAYLPELARARAEASERSGLNTSEPFTVRAFASTPAFRSATLAPGWVAAFTEGNWIATQPLRTLAARHLLDATLRHEFLHTLVEGQAGAAAPLWLREGLVEVWAAGAGEENRPPALSRDAVDAALAHATTEEESARAHGAAAWYAARLLQSYGRQQTLEWLRSGLPASVASSLDQR